MRVQDPRAQEMRQGACTSIETRTGQELNTLNAKVAAARRRFTTNHNPTDLWVAPQSHKRTRSKHNARADGGGDGGWDGARGADLFRRCVRWIAP